MLTRMGEITFEVPQVRSGGFYPSALERGSRSEQSVNLALAEMYVQGVSTRKVIESVFRGQDQLARSPWAVLHE
jgi:putative transposase